MCWFGRELKHLRYLFIVGGSRQLCRWSRSRVSCISCVCIGTIQMTEPFLCLNIEHPVSQHDQISVLLERVPVQRS